MRSYNPENNRTADPKEVIRDFFENDLTEPDSFIVFRRDLIDYFSVKKEARSVYRPYWLLSVYAYWHFITQISTEDAIKNLVERIPDGVRLGFNVYKDFIYYLRLKFFTEQEMQFFYSKVQEQIINSDVPVGLKNGDMKLSDLCREVEILNSFSEDTIKTAEFFEKLQHLLFDGSESDAIREYVIVEPGEATSNLVGLINFIINTEARFIWPASDAEMFAFTTGYDPSTIPAPVSSLPKDWSRALDLPEIENLPEPELPPDLKNKKPVLDEDVHAEDLYKMFNVPLAEVAVTGAPAPATAKPIEPLAPKPAPGDVKPAAMPETSVKPAYADIKAKVDSAFPKDKNGAYKDLDGVLMALAKAADKYNDPKIAELYYFDESAGNFRWNV